MKLPHISHLFSAHLLSPLLKASFVFIWLTILMLNTHTRIVITPLSPSALAILTKPFDSLAHIPLARRFWVSGNIQEALRELALSDPSSVPAVLGAQAQQVLTSWETEPNARALEMAFWEGVIAKHPDYPDGYLGAAVASIADRQNKQAETFIASLLSLDPNNTTGQRLKNLFEKAYEDFP